MLSALSPQVLVTTEMGSRGLDFPNVAVVVNFEPPADTRAYLHRAGRAGRYAPGLSSPPPGTVITLVCSGDDEGAMASIREELGLEARWPCLLPWTCLSCCASSVALRPLCLTCACGDDDNAGLGFSRSTLADSCGGPPQGEAYGRGCSRRRGLGGGSTG